MEEALFRIEIFYTTTDYRSDVIKNKLNRLGYAVDRIYMSDNYLVNAPITPEQAELVARSLTQPVTQSYLINEPYMPEEFNVAVQIGFLPGVTDNVAHTVRESIEDLLKMKLDQEKSVFSCVTYFLKLPDPGIIGQLTRELYNPLIERIRILTAEEYRSGKGMGNTLPLVKISSRAAADEVDLHVGEEELARIGKEGIKDGDGTRRGPLALDMLSLNVIKNYFHGDEKRNPTDIELESIAQTWSEHCKHTIFAAELDDIQEGIYKHYIKEATIRIRREKGPRDFCVSVFTDNAGGIIFDDDYIVADKVETHNSPSALDPFGGSITGIVGVNRDAIGFGMASRPIANRYGFCFADPHDERPLYRDKNEESRLLPPRRIMEGVIHGVNAGGNTSGIPTPQGFVYFDERYKGKPLVFVGTVGILPRVVRGNSAVQKKAMPGDNIVMIGGRVGRDGIHGATFSSEALNSGSPATAVQIGDPITQKKLSDAVVKEARDMGLYNSITDNGAGGLSCSVAEMARESGGFEVHLEKIPLKYPGLAPWQIWVSESQERMTLSVPDNNLEAFLSLMEHRGVEASVIGRFNDGRRGIVYYHGDKIFDLDMEFLHDGLPKKALKTVYTRHDNACPEFSRPADMNETFADMISRLNTASFDFISYQYDHEVQGNSLIKPLQGKGRVNGNVTVIQPVFDSPRAVVLSQGLYPSYSDIDTYWMAACSIDTAIRNAVSAGGTLDHLALLDNFCWCDSNNPERLGQLKEAARGCYDFSVAYGTPFISGKDSMFNDFRGYDGDFNEVQISIPPTLLISSFGVVYDKNACQTMDFKFDGDLIYLLGETADETGGSEYLAYVGERLSGKKYIGNNIPRVDAVTFSRMYRAYTDALSRGLVSSGVSIERGGLGVALAKSSMAGLLGCSVDLSAVPCAGKLREDVILYSESQGRLLMSVNPARRKEAEAAFKGLPFAFLGTVQNTGRIRVKGFGGGDIVNAELDMLMDRYKSVFRGY